MWTGILSRLLRQLIRRGSLRLVFPDGTEQQFGDGAPPRVAVALHDAGIARKLVINPYLYLGEGYTDGRITIEGDDLHGLLELALTNIESGNERGWYSLRKRLRASLRAVQQFNPLGRARQNVAHHYDLSDDLYTLFLDPDRQYSCAYFRTPQDTLEQAQAQKKAHIAAKLLLRPGMRVLDIGCGWGGMALTLAREHGVHVTGITLSERQHRMATDRAAGAGLGPDRVTFALKDYRAMTGRFDRIVSVGMFEHVGAPHFQTYFNKVQSLLEPDGVALIHTIGRMDPPGATNPWIAKYIFPGGYVPAMSEVLAAIERSALWTTDVEIWRLHYAMTLRHWHDRFVANQHKLGDGHDARFSRMWRYYLTASEAAFRHSGQVVFQFQLTRDRHAVPLTRDYLYASAGARAAAE